MSSDGMNALHKDKFCKAMDLFKVNNGGCLLCTDEIKEFYFETKHDKCPIVTLYGLCQECESNMYKLRKTIDAKLKAWSEEKDLQFALSSSEESDIRISIEKPRVLVCNFVK